MKNIVKSFSLIINYKTFIVTALSVISTWACFQMNLIAKFPDMLVGVAIVFPVVFSIGSAYTRRETALQRLADFKGHAIALYFATRDWTSVKTEDLPSRSRKTITQIMIQTREMFKIRERSQLPAKEKVIYGLFSEMSKITMEMREFGTQSGEISRASQYVSKMIIAFDNLKIIHLYRTPITLRAYSKAFIYSFPIIYGPYFASTAREFSTNLEYVMPILYSFILVSLDNIQDHLENPFDGVGEDDITIEGEEIEALMH